MLLKHTLMKMPMALGIRWYVMMFHLLHHRYLECGHAPVNIIATEWGQFTISQLNLILTCSA